MWYVLDRHPQPGQLAISQYLSLISIHFTIMVKLNLSKNNHRQDILSRNLPMVLKYIGIILKWLV